MTRLGSFFPRPFAEYYYFLVRLETNLKLMLFLADKLPAVFAESLARVAEGASISSAGVFELLKRLMIEIDTHYFPLYVDLESDADELLTREIPIMVFAITEEDTPQIFDSLTALVYAVLAPYYGDLGPDDVPVFEPGDMAAIFPQTDDDDGNVRRIKDRLEALPTGHPARGALATLRLIEREDANIFISSSYLDGNNDTEWDDYWFDLLTEDWREAKPVIDAHYEFVKWLDEGLYAREEAFIRYIGGTIDELDENIYPKEA